MGKGSKVFSLLVIGENPDEVVKKYDEALEVPKYIKYAYKSAGKLHANAIKMIEEFLRQKGAFSLSQFHVDYFSEKLTHLKEMSDFDYYAEITSGLYIDDNGDAWSTENKDGKYQTCCPGKNFALPLKLKDGREVFSARKGEVDWGFMHLNPRVASVYEKTWDIIKNGVEPTTPDEKKIKVNMSDQENYFSKFKDKMQYVIHNCAYWNYAVINEEGWTSMDDAKTQTEWLATFFPIYIEPLSDDTLLTVYECTKGKEL